MLAQIIPLGSGDLITNQPGRLAGGYLLPDDDIFDNLLVYTEIF